MTAEEHGQRNPLRKILQVLNWMIEAPPEGGGVREMAQVLGLAPSTVHRVLRLLEHEGLVRADPRDGRYALGLEFFRLASRATARFPVSSVAMPVMRRLVDACNETALLILYDPARMEAMFVASVESRHPLRYVVELGRWVPVYAAASGLAIMAFLPEPERREIVARTGLEPLTERTITDPAQLEQVMVQIRRRGYACSMSQRIPGAVGIGAPIWGPDHRVVGALQLSLPEQRFEAAAESELASLVMRFAGQITEQLGGRSNPPWSGTGSEGLIADS